MYMLPNLTAPDKRSTKGYMTFERAGMEAADKIIAVSQLTKNTIVSKYGIPEEKVVVVHNAVLDTSIIKSKEKEEGARKDCHLPREGLLFRKGRNILWKQPIK